MAVSGLKKHLRTAVVILAFIAAYSAFNQFGRTYLSRFLDSDEVIKSKIERVVADWRTYRVLKEKFRADYDELLDQSVQDFRQGRPVEEAALLGAQFTESLRRREVKNFGMASIDALRQSLRDQVPLLMYLNATYGWRTCNEMAINGGSALVRLLGKRFLEDKELLRLANDAGARYFEAAAEGRELKIVHAPPTDDDWQALANNMQSNGFSLEELSNFSDPSKGLDNPTTCETSIKFINFVTDSDSDPSSRIIPFLATAGAAE